MQYGFDKGVIGVAAGTIDEGSLKAMGMNVSEHIFVEQKVGWYDIPDDGVKRWGRFSDGFEEKLDVWRRGRS